MKNKYTAGLLCLILLVTPLHAQTQSLETWLSQLPGIEAAEADPTVDALEMGCAMYVLYDNVGGDGRSAGVRDMAALVNFQQWLSSTGNTLMSQWFSGTLDPADEKYLWLLRAVAMTHYFNDRSHPSYRNTASNEGQYFLSVAAAGEAVMRKAYRNEALSQTEFDQLREYILLDDIQNSTTKVMPYELNLMPQNQPEIGDDAFDFYLPTVDTVLARAAYTETIDLWDEEALNASSMTKFLPGFQAYTTAADGIHVTPRAYTVDAADAGNAAAAYVRLSDNFGQKPTLVLINRRSDGYWYRVGERDLEQIYQAYKDHLDVYAIQTSYNDDSVLFDAYTGNFAGESICMMFPHTQELLAYESKQIDIRDAYTSYPTLVDTVGSPTRSAYASSGGNGYWVLIDKQGKVAASMRMAIIQNGTYERDYTGRDAWANQLEQEIRLLLANDGVAVTEAPHRTQDVLGRYPTEAAAVTAQHRSYFIEDRNGSFTVTAVNGNVITADKAYGSSIGGTKTYQLTVGADTVLIENRDTITVNDFSPGDSINILFYGNDYPWIGPDDYAYRLELSARYGRFSLISDRDGNGIITPRAIWRGGIRGDRIDSDVWGTGIITAIDIPNQEVTVRLRDVDADTFHGYRYYQQAGGSISLFDSAAANLAAVASWVNDSAPIDYTLALNAMSDIFLDGFSTDIGSLSVGQQVGFAFTATTSRTVSPHIIRASSPVTVSDIRVPELNYVGALSSTTLEVVFNEDVDAASAENVGNYSLTGGLSVTQASLNGNVVTLTVSPAMTSFASHTLYVNHVSDTSGNVILPSSYQAFTYDVNPPTVVSSTVLNNRTIELVFSKSLTAASAREEANYVVTPALDILRADYDEGRPDRVTLRTEVIAEDTIHTLTLNHLQDRMGQNIAANTQVTLALGPVVWLPFDEGAGDTAIDAMGLLPPVSLLSGTSWGAGRHGSGLQTTGAGGLFLISHSDATAMQFNPVSDDFSVSVWFKTSQSGVAQALVWKGYSLPQYALYIGTDNQLHASVNGNLISIPTAVTDGQWHLATLVGDQATVTLYLDDGTASASMAAVNSSNSLDIGVGRRTGNSWRLTGEIDDLKVYDFALDQQRIARKYHGHTLLQQWRLANFGTVSETGLYANQADYDFDGTPNIVEYFYGTDPVSEDASFSDVDLLIENGVARIRYPVNTQATDVNWIIETSHDMSQWSPAVDATLDAQYIQSISTGQALYEASWVIGELPLFVRIRFLD